MPAEVSTGYTLTVTQPTARARRPLLAIAAVVLVALALRLWRLAWGLEYGGFPDEALFWVKPGQDFVPLTLASFDADKLVPYPTLYRYLMGLGVIAAHALGLVATPPLPWEVILVGRAVSAVAGTATVVLVGLLGARLYSPRAGLCAAALLAVAPFPVMQSHYISVDVVLAMLGGLALFAAWRAADGGSRAGAGVAGAAVGLAAATKYNGVVFLAAPLWAAVEVAWRRRTVRSGLAIVGAVAVGLVLGFLLGCPPCVIHPHRLRAALHWLGSLDVDALPGFFGSRVPAPGLGWYGHRVLYPIVAGLPYALGWPLYLASLLGVAGACRRRAPGDRLVLVAVLAGFVSIAPLRVTLPRYLLPIIPFLVLLAGRALAGNAARWSPARAAAFCFVALYSLVLTTSQVGRFSYDQQREVAEWLRVRLAATAGARPVVATPDTLGFYTGLGAPFGWARLTLEERKPEHWLALGADAFVMPHIVANAIRRDQPAGQMAQLLDRLESGGAGYLPARTWRARYLDDRVYTWLDPMFEGDVWQGAIGFTVYLREPGASDTTARPAWKAPVGTDATCGPRAPCAATCRWACPSIWCVANGTACRFGCGAASSQVTCISRR